MKSSTNPAGTTAAMGGGDGIKSPSPVSAAARRPPHRGTAVLGDDALIAAAASGDKAAWSALVERYLGQITGHAWYMLGDPREAEDVAQEAFIRLVAKAPDWESGGAKLKTWLYRVVVNLCIDRKRKQLPLPLATLPEFGDGSADERDRGIDLKNTVRAALDALPPRQRAAIVLTYYQGFSNRETADLLGVGDEAVESLLARGRRTLRASLAELKCDLIGDVT